MNTPKLPTDWSAHQAYAVLNILEHLHQMIWELYEPELVGIILHENSHIGEHQQADNQPYADLDFDDDIPF